MLAIKAQFDYAQDFSEGLAAVLDSDCDKCGYIDQTGKMVIELRGKRLFPAGPFSEGLAPVVETGPESPVPFIRDGVRVGYIDKSGKVVIGPQFGWVDADFMPDEAGEAWWGWTQRSSGRNRHATRLSSWQPFGPRIIRGWHRGCRRDGKWH